jgi:hypothetical protein
MDMLAATKIQEFEYGRRLAQPGRKKRINGLRLSQACRRYATPSSISFFDRHHKNAHTAEDESVKSHSKSICQSSASLSFTFSHPFG